MHDQILKGHLLVLLLSTIANILNLCTSLAACIPQPDHGDRPIYNYTFSGLNNVVLSSAPDKAIQFGRALPCLLWQILNTPPHLGLVFMPKNDLFDAYMCVWVEETNVPKLASIPPLASDTEPQIGFHLSLPMGYVESAAYFCAANETIADFANAKGTYPPHPLKHKALTLPQLPNPAAAKVVTPREEAAMSAYFSELSKTNIQSCIDYFDVYVGDFITLHQGMLAMCLVSTQKLFHCIDTFFCPNDTDDRVRQEPNSIKKLRRGDAWFTYVKTILGWVIKSITNTIHLTKS